MLRETAEGWIYEVKEKTVFDPATIRRLELTKTVGVIVGQRAGSTLMEVQGIRFSKQEFDKEKIEEWIATYMKGALEPLERMAKRELAPAQVLDISAAEQKVMAALGHAALKKGNVDRAKTIFQGIITLNPLSNMGYTGMGLVLQAQKQMDAAMNSFKEALSHNPSDCDALLGQVEILIGKGQKKPALPLLLQVMSIDRDGIEPAGSTARDIFAAQYSTDDLKDFLNWGEQKLHAMAKETLRAQGKAIKTLSGAPTPAAAAAGVTTSKAAIPQAAMRRA